MDKIIIGKPILKYWPKVIGCPLFLLIPDKTTFAEAPIKVPLPPRHAPRDKAHQIGVTSIP